MKTQKPPLLAALVVYVSRAALGIWTGATSVMLGSIVAWWSGYPLSDARRIGNSAWDVWCLAAAIYAACVGVAWLADRKRGIR